MGKASDKEILIDLAKTGRAKSLIFSGPPGTGKNSAARLFATTYYGIDYDDLMRDGESIFADYLEVNASGDRGIDAMKGPVQTFAKLRSYTGKAKILVLDEAEGLTPAAKEILKSIVEKLAHNCIFIFCTNNSRKLTSAIFSRSAVFRFDPIPLDEGLEWLNTRAAEQGIDMGVSIAERVYSYYKGDLRRIISDFLNVFKGQEVVKWKPDPTHADEIFSAKDPAKKYIAIAGKTFIDPNALLHDLIVLNKYKNPEIFAKASIMLNGGGDPLIAVLYALTGLVKGK